MTYEELLDEIAEKEAEIKDLESKRDSLELDPDDYAQEFRDFLDEEGTVKIGSLEFYPSQIVEELDPTSFRCGLNDYLDSIDKTETQEYKDLSEQIEEAEDELETLQDDLAELEEEEERREELSITK